MIVIPNGRAAGAPGPIGSPTIYEFWDAGDPNLIPDPLGMLANAAPGSTFTRTDIVAAPYRKYPASIQLGTARNWQ